jgi:hypothetical protein
MSIARQTGRKDKNDNMIYGSIEIDGKMTEGGDRLTDYSDELHDVVFGKLPLSKSGGCVCSYDAFYCKCLGRPGVSPMYDCTEIGDWMEIIGTQWKGE